MSARLAAHVEVAALLRRAAAAGGNGAVLARGDREGGAILLVLAERGRVVALRERRPDPAGDHVWAPAGPADAGDAAAVAAYVERRRRVDRDLWVIELDVAEAERFAV